MGLELVFGAFRELWGRGLVLEEWGGSYPDLANVMVEGARGCFTSLSPFASLNLASSWALGPSYVPVHKMYRFPYVPLSGRCKKEGPPRGQLGVLS